MIFKKGDEVKVISGSDKGKIAKIAAVLTHENKVVLEGEGLRVAKCHTKPSQANPDGGIVTKAVKIDASNVQLVVGKKKELTRVGYQMVADNSKKGSDKTRKARVSIKTKEVLD